MGTPIFGIDLAAIVADKIGPGLHPVIITRKIAGARSAGSLTGGPAITPTVFKGARGIWQDVPRSPPPGVEIKLTDRVALLLGDTIPAGAMPQAGDAITIRGKTLHVVQIISDDPVSASIGFLCRDRAGPDGV